ncbi:MAG: DUF1839 family protein, partial [Polyangiales bacterium]
MSAALALSAARHRAHALHGEARAWPETNCYVDLWIEVLHALGHDPHAMLGCALTCDFEDDQWLFFKPATSDLYALYGVDVQELTIWRSALDHVCTQVERGNLPLIEVDAYHLPDTRGVSYGQKHAKTTIAIAAIDRAEKRLGYFHNAGYYALAGSDFDGVFAASVLPPYTEYVRLRGARVLDGRSLASRARVLLGAHLARAPRENPFARYRKCFARDLAELSQAPSERFHEYAFATVRQFGAAFELSASYLGWLAEHGDIAAEAARAPAAEIASLAKTLQFKAARAVMRRRDAECDALFDGLEAAWEGVYQPLRLAH